MSSRSAGSKAETREDVVEAAKGVMEDDGDVGVGDGR